MALNGRTKGGHPLYAKKRSSRCPSHVLFTTFAANSKVEEYIYHNFIYLHSITVLLISILVSETAPFWSEYQSHEILPARIAIPGLARLRRPR
jgi:hypothetical protein